MSFHNLSIVIPTHNNGVELRRAVMSILAQDIRSVEPHQLEILIVNDGSDSSYLPQLLELEEEFVECRLLNLDTQSGPAAARNRGIEAAHGDLIGFLDADDEWPENKLSLQLPYFESEEIDVAGGKIKYMLSEGQEALNMKFEDQESRLTHVHLGALLVRKRIFEEGLYFEETLGLSEDVDWWYRLREKQANIVISEATTLLYHVHGSNMSVNKDIEELQLLKILHNSVKRRQMNDNRQIPQLRDFRTEKEDPLISIIIPLYNGRDLIQKTIQSVLSQSYTHWELIIVDDGSSDQGADFIAENFPQASLIRQENGGVAAARNTGVQHSKGEVIAFLDQDDEWLPSKLRAQWDLLKADPYCAFVTCNQNFICEPGVTLPANFSEKLFEEHRSLVPSALLIRKHSLLQVNGFDESLEVSSDFDLIRRLRKANFKEGNVDKPLLKKWYHGHNASLDTSVMRNEILSLLHRQIKGK